MPGYEDTEAGFQAGLDSFEELTGTGPERDPDELRQDLIHQMGLADRRPARPRGDLPDITAVREQMGF